jgi:transcriptional regulator with XRE-family HTH domain
MCERIIQQEFRDGVDEVLSAATRKWYVDHFTRSKLTESELAELIGYTRPQLNKWHNGGRHLDPTPLALLALAFAKVAERKPGFTVVPLDMPSSSEAVLGGLLYALNRAGERFKIRGSRCGPLFYFCLQALTTDRSWIVATLGKKPQELEEAATKVLKTARQQAGQFQRSLLYSWEMFSECLPDSPDPKGAACLQQLLRIWKKPWEQIHEVIHLEVDCDPV